MHVPAWPNEDCESLYRRFKRGFEPSGVLREIRERQWFQSPAERKRLRRRKAARRQREAAKLAA